MITCKWPGLVVLGEKIHPDLALEIIVRTMFPLYTNQHKYLEEIYSRCVGRKVSFSYSAPPEVEEKAIANIGGLPLTYMRSSWVASNWIGGPHGWCRPDGQIRSSNYNVGKWPTDEEISQDLALIAQTWPSLRFTVQCLDREHWGEEGDPKVSSQWEVKDGEVLLCEAVGQPLLESEELRFSLGNEIGIDPDLVFQKIDELLLVAFLAKHRTGNPTLKV